MVYKGCTNKYLLFNFRCLIPTNVTKELNHTIQRQLEHCNFSSSTPSSLSSVASAVMATAPSESHTSATATPSSECHTPIY